jgi:hypothetical protein
LFLGRNKSDLILELTAEAFHNIPRIVNYIEVASLGGRGIVVCCLREESPYLNKTSTAPSSKSAGMDLYLRGFFPNIGLNEDFVTGSALCALAPYFYSKYDLHSRPHDCFDGLKAYQNSLRGGSSLIRLIQDGHDYKDTAAVLTPKVSITADCVMVNISAILV